MKTSPFRAGREVRKYVYAVKVTRISKTFISILPQPLIYNFTANSIITSSDGEEIPIWNTMLIIKIDAYN